MMRKFILPIVGICMMCMLASCGREDTAKEAQSAQDEQVRATQETTEEGQEKHEGTKEQTDDSTVAEEPSEEELQYKAYYDLYLEYEEKYGATVLTDSQPLGENPSGEAAKAIEGVAVVQLIDFNNDGNEELVLGYETGSSESVSYQCEVWAWENGELIQALAPIEANHGQWPMCWFETVVDGDDVLLVQDYASGTVEYLSYAEGAFQAKYKLEENPFLQKAVINGETVSFEEMEAFHNDLPRTASEIMYEPGYLNEDGKGLYISFNYMGEEDAAEILGNTQENVEKLRSGI